jgi:ABC-type multidrug transport system ATPase subunit
MDIVLDHVYKQYSKQTVALRDINLRIEQGMFGLLGPNGAGKTTMLRMLATLIAPTSGRIFFNGKDLSKASERKQVRYHLGYLPQELGLYPDLKAEEFLEYFALLKGLADRNAYRKQIAKLLEIVNLSQHAKKKVKTFSGGMKRRLGIAQALLGDPHVVIVDEPTAGLDPEERISLRQILTELAQERIIILSTHVVEDIGQTCDTVAILDKGEIAFHGRLRELLKRAEGFTWEFVSQREVTLPSNLHVITMLPQVDGIHYRVVGTPGDLTMYQLLQVQPTLEDSYVLQRKVYAQQKIGEANSSVQHSTPSSIAHL